MGALRPSVGCLHRQRDCGPRGARGPMARWHRRYMARRRVGGRSPGGVVVAAGRAIACAAHHDRPRRRAVFD
jgi:hypothetical protein